MERARAREGVARRGWISALHRDGDRKEAPRLLVMLIRIAVITAEMRSGSFRVKVGPCIELNLTGPRSDAVTLLLITALRFFQVIQASIRV
jgi:hypothetical protein